ncbi:nucleotide sugar dehydrogenase [Persicitalea sp.]|uniref:nucleotide sugar dehydrogenase n=1 Tax=Persicitalea sp. TaxID=3100273 RepID=UPI0035935209
MRSSEHHKIAVIGLGYVGLPLAIEFSKRREVVGFDTNCTRISQLMDGVDHTREVSKEQLELALNLTLSCQTKDLKNCEIYIVTVPTPIDQFNKPDLGHLIAASTMVAKLLKKGDIVVYESTVYPGCTEEVCVPILEKQSGLKYNTDFFCGYSPERINPGDKERTLTKILKIVSGSTPETADRLEELYGSIIEVGVYKAPSMKVAEAAKAIENAQRDINISFINELALMFDRMGIDTTEVLEAAGTKWNFLKFTPGLVGGHCIGVDPYYLVHKAQSLGYIPQVISSGRAINDGMGAFVAKKLLKAMIANGLVLQKSRVLILGITFKENCPDIRNTKVMDVYRELKDFGLETEVYDPWALPAEVQGDYGIALTDSIEGQRYDGIVVAVAHREFFALPIESYRKDHNSIVFDLKAIFEKGKVDLRF